MTGGSENSLKTPKTLEKKLIGVLGFIDRGGLVKILDDRGPLADVPFGHAWYININ